MHQLVPVLSPGDAVSDCALMFRRIFQSWGLRSEIFGESIAGKSEGFTLDQLPKDLSDRTGILLHHSIGSGVAERFIELRADYKILFFQNITPPVLLRTRPDLASRAVLGLQQLQRMVRAADQVLTASRFSAGSMPRFGPLPIVVPLAVSAQRAEQLLAASMNRREPGDNPQFLHVGRIVPHKAVEDVLRVFWVIQRSLTAARLVLVGADDQVPAYTSALRGLVEDLGLKNVSFRGHVGADELVRIFTDSDVYICGGHHEGFCVPPMECMFAELPVVAFSQEAIVETIGDAGIIVDERDPFLMGDIAAEIARDRLIRAVLRERQRVRREIFTESAMSARLKRVLSVPS